MARKSNNESVSKRKAIIARTLIRAIVIVVIAIVFIIFSRGRINYINRMDFIARRLEDYPRMLENHLVDLEEMRALCLTSDYDQLAEQAAFLYDRSDMQFDEAKKLGIIAELLGLAKVSVIPASGQASATEEVEAKGLDMAFAPPIGRSSHCDRNRAQREIPRV